jgi:hypothetical protein
MNAAIPVSKATNAYELLDEIKALALEEPKRMNMGLWRVEDGDEWTIAAFEIDLPSCGTVGCIGGWAEVLAGSSDALGLTWCQSEELFSGDALIAESIRIGQTVEHAQHVADHITAFQQKYEAQLKAKAVTR